MTAAAQRVVVTGLGVVSPLGNSLEEFSDNLLAGKSGAGKIESFDASSLATHIAAEVRNFDATIAVRDRKISFGVAASRSAIAVSARSTLCPVSPQSC